jgi:hypothetical protein
VKTRHKFIVAGLVAVVALVLVVPIVPLCRDWAFVDQNTGSRKGHRAWFIGWRTGIWYRESALEAFMRAKHPEAFQQSWVSYAGTGRNIFGQRVLHGHGRPGPIIQLVPEVLDAYCGHASDQEKRRLYEVFASADRQKIPDLVNQIHEAEMNNTDQRPERDRTANGSQPPRPETNQPSSRPASRR